MLQANIAHQLALQWLPPGKEAQIAYASTQIQRAEERIAEEVAEWMKSDSSPVIAIPIMDGAMFFGMSVTRLLPSDGLEVATVRTKAYRGTELNTEPVQIYPPLPDVAGKRVIVFEDIVDSGKTLEALTELFKANGAIEVKIAALLCRDVPERKIQADWVGIRHEGDEWFFGYGMDLDGKFRNLSDIYALNDALPKATQVSVIDQLGLVLGENVRPFTEDDIGFSHSTERTNVLGLLQGERSNTASDGIAAFEAVLDVGKMLGEDPKNAARTPFDTHLHRLQFFAELANHLLWPETDARIQHEGTEIRPLVVGFRGSFLRGKHDPSDLDMILYYDMKNWDKGKASECNLTITNHVQEFLERNENFLLGAGSALRSRGIDAAEFPVQIQSGASVLYKKPEFQTQLQDPLLLFAPGKDRGQVCVRFLRGSDEWYRRFEKL